MGKKVRERKRVGEKNSSIQHFAIKPILNPHQIALVFLAAQKL